MSDYYYHHDDDSIIEEEDDNSKKLNDKDVYSSDRAFLGNVKVSLGDFILIKSEEDSLETRYKIPRNEVERIDDRSITLRSNKKDIERKYPKSRFKETSHNGKRGHDTYVSNNKI